MEKSFLENLYRKMLTIRLAEECLIDPILKGEVKTPCHLYTGQEASAVGVCAALESGDQVFSNHRGHGHYLAKGGDLNRMLAEIYTKETGCSRGRGGSMHLMARDCNFMGSAPIISQTVAMAVGAALADSIKKNGQIAATFFGDGAAGEGIIYESLNFAALKCLPVIFVCENNLYSTHLHIRECRPGIPLYKIAEPFGIAAAQVGGNDILKVYEAAKIAAKHCRAGLGPYFIESLTYRMRGHVGPDDNIQGQHTDIRPQAEVDEWRAKDPVMRFEKYLLENKIFDKDELETVKQEITEKVKKAQEYAIDSPRPVVSDLQKHVFE
ncbi:MAG: thiamine pyrophosphate-dependent dehydrogenase E1 component subunit alpha [Candidatus Pacebacteria bacterium]|jgi:pyruvate dehydrogenase E1 component alpha subunit|nr:thiamine pyrophosphate-dependent dehydrogenase E1 component subunit alpha [Candidatus Paceibacterota bacterium]